MIGAIIGAVGSIGSAIAGAVTGNNAAKAQEKMLKEQSLQNEHDYLNESRKNYLDRTDARYALERARKASQERMANARGMAAVTGDQSMVGAAQAAEADAYGNTVAGLAGQADIHKDRLRQTYEQRRDNIDAMRYAAQSEKMQSASNAVSNGISGLAGVSSALVDGAWGSPSPGTPMQAGAMPSVGAKTKPSASQVPSGLGFKFK